MSRLNRAFSALPGCAAALIGCFAVFLGGICAPASLATIGPDSDLTLETRDVEGFPEPAVRRLRSLYRTDRISRDLAAPSRSAGHGQPTGGSARVLRGHRLPNGLCAPLLA